MASTQLQSLAALLAQSLNPSHAKAAEQSLRASESQPGFPILLLHVATSSDFDVNSRLAGALFFKNLIRRRWTDEDGNYLLAAQDVTALKAEIIDLMISLPAGPVQVQIGEAISTMADSDFPDRWPDLVSALVNRLGSDMKTNNGVLIVAHSIFRRWRPLFSSDELFAEIKLVLTQFVEPFLSVLKQTDSMIEAASSATDGVAVSNLRDLFDCLHTLMEIFYDLNCQDIPEFFEDHLEEFMTILHRYLVYSNNALSSSDDDETGVLELVKASICEILELYTLRYEDVFGKLIPKFVEPTWHLLTSLGPEPKYDLLICRAFAFLTAVAKNQNFTEIFSSDQVLDSIVSGIVVPNMTLRPSDEELFEDDPIEFTRRDLEGSDSDSRRRAATDFVRELTEKLEAKVTHVFMGYIQTFLANYKANPASNWRQKDTATYLYTSIAAKGNITGAGVSSTNLLLDVVQFFSENIAPDLVTEVVSPILKVDAIKYIHTFRNQLTKDQLVSAFPLLSSHLSSSDYVVHTYAAVTIERILSIRVTRDAGAHSQSTPANPALMFGKADISSAAQGLLTNLFGLILKDSSTPEKLAENEFLMKCVMRILITAQDSTAPYAETLLKQLVQIVLTIAKNPSNPKFSHFTFEAVGAVIRFDSTSLGTSKVEDIVLNPFLGILGEDVAEFVPYVFQILTQILRVSSEVNPNAPLAPVYQSLIRPLMSPTLWESRGNVPALVGLLEAVLSRSGSLILETNSLEPLLGIFQKLVASRANDTFGFDLLEHVYNSLPAEALSNYASQISLLLLQRLKTSKTDKYVSRYSKFIYFLAAVEGKPGLGPVYAIDFIDSVQSDLFGQILEQFMLPSTLQIRSRADRKVAAIGLTNILTKSPKFVDGVYSAKWAAALQVLLKLVQTSVPEPMNDSSALLRELDLEDVSFGATFAKLATSVSIPLDVAPSIKDPEPYLVSQLQAFASASGPQAYQLINQLPEDVKAQLTQLGFS